MTVEQIPVYKTAHRIATDHLRAAILSGRLGPGAVISQDEVATQLRVSRQPVREALRELASEGLIELRPHRSAVVVSLKDEDIAEIFGIRALLEAKAVELAVPRIGSADRAELERYLADMSAAIDGEDAERWLTLNREFHQAITAHCPWRRLRALIEAQHNALAPYFRMWSSAHAAPRLIGQMPAFHVEHRAILEAIERGDSEGAAAATARHVYDTSQQLRSFLTELGGAVAAPAPSASPDGRSPVISDSSVG